MRAAAQTDGLVNPLLGRRLEQLGYDRDFALLTACADEVLTLPTDVLDPAAWRRIGLDPDGAIRVPPGTALDLGATARPGPPTRSPPPSPRSSPAPRW